MVELMQPSAELAASVLRQVSFKERLGGYVQNVSAGSIFCELYSLESIIFFLQVDPFDAVLMPGSHSSISYIDLTVLARWVAEVLGDVELAEAIREASGQEEVYAKQVGPVRKLLEQRFQQSLAVLGKEEKNNEDTDIVA